MVNCKLCEKVIQGPAYVSKCEKILHIKCATQIIGDGGSCKLDECPYKYYEQLKQDEDCSKQCSKDCCDECPPKKHEEFIEGCLSQSSDDECC